MHRRLPLLVLLVTTLACTGLGLYSCYQRTRVGPILVFYGVAGYSVIAAYLLVKPPPNQRLLLLRSALRQVTPVSLRHLRTRCGEPPTRAFRRLGVALYQLVRRLSRVTLLTLVMLNGFAGLAVALCPSPQGLLVAFLLWTSGVIALVSASRSLRARAKSARMAALAISDATGGRAGRCAVSVAVAGWLLLLAGLWILGLHEVPRFLEDVDIGLRQLVVAAINPQTPIPITLCVLGLLTLAAGMFLIDWGRAGVPDLAGKPTFTIQSSSFSTRHCLLHFRRALPLVGIWGLGSVVYATAVRSAHWSILPLWLLALVAMLVHWWRVDRTWGASILPLRFERTLWLLAPALVLAFCVTLYRLEDVPNSVWKQDEWEFLRWARDLAMGVEYRSPFDLGVFQAFPVISSMYQSLWIKLFGFGLWSWRFGSVLIGTLTLLPLFFLVRKLLGTRIAWSATVLLICSPYFLAYTRLGYNNIQPLLPATLGLWLVLEAAQKHSGALAYLSGVACGLASLTYSAGHLSLILNLWVCLFLFVRRRELRRTLPYLTLLLVTGWLFAAGPFVFGNMLGGRSVGSKAIEFHGKR
jgi:hypothetical protein